MALWFIHAEAFTGDADGPVNMDLFMHATDVHDAVKKWKKHFDGWDMPDELTAYDLRTSVRGPDGVLPWEHIQSQEIKL